MAKAKQDYTPEFEMDTEMIDGAIIKTQNSQIERLKAQNDNLQKEIEKLKAENENLTFLLGVTGKGLKL